MPTPTSLAITPSSITPAVGRTVQLTATVTYDDGSTANVTTQCTWSSSNVGVLTVSAGLVTGVAVGSADITASYTEATGGTVKATLATDDFNRSDGSLAGSGQWAHMTSWQLSHLIQDQGIWSQPWDPHKYGDYWAQSFGPDQWAEIQLREGQNYNLALGVVVRSDAAGLNYYYVENHLPHVLRWGKMVNGVRYGVHETNTGGIDVGDYFGLAVQGNRITVLKNGSPFFLIDPDGGGQVIQQFEDSTIADGYVGITTDWGPGNDTRELRDNFRAGSYAQATITKTATLTATVHEYVPRFRLSGPFESSLKCTDLISGLLSTFGGLLTWSQGKWCVSFPSYKDPVIDLTDDDARGPVQYETQVSKRDRCNGVKGVYISPDNQWQASDFPAYANPKFIAEDSGKQNATDRGNWRSGATYHVNDAVMNGANAWFCNVEHVAAATNEPGNGAESATYWEAVTNRIWRDVRLPFTVSASDAQRLAKLECIRSRMRPLKYIAGPRAYRVRPGDIVTVTHKRFGFDKKRFEVKSTNLLIEDGENGPEIKVPLVLREDIPDGYTWNAEAEEKDPTPPGPITVVTSGPIQRDGAYGYILVNED